MEHGVLNSLVTALMPTASTSQIMSANECFEPITSNIYKRKVLSGEFIIANKYLIDDLIGLNLWTEEIRQQMIITEGSIQNIAEIPDDIKKLYKNVWEISQRTIIDMAADRAPYIDQSQSMNLFVEEPNFSKLSSMHFHVWNKGLKSIYYLRSKARSRPQQFTIDPNVATAVALKEAAYKESKKRDNMVCTDEVCLMCSA
jgi:ribonucleotide reductase alpha subunit